MGDPEANYDLKVSASTIKQDNNGNNSPSSIDVYILKSRKGIFTKWELTHLMIIISHYNIK